MEFDELHTKSDYSINMAEFHGKIREFKQLHTSAYTVLFIVFLQYNVINFLQLEV